MPQQPAHKRKRTVRARRSRSPGGDVAHAGRVTAPRAGTPASGRYTPPARTQFRVRPGWHKIAGVAVIGAGAALFFTCRFNGWGIHRYGGHIWYLVGMGIAATSLWWFGAFDRTPPPAARRS